ncbi:MAG TPA: endo alpha-1,4 polygalactosaminidase [Acidimicrobiales bacterium]|nr:endo alpha-1,4 polygalactosaminidase [Acidimicrobiales bacterium]
MDKTHHCLIAKVAVAVATACSLSGLVPLAANADPTTTTNATPSPSWWQPGPLQSWAYVIGESFPLTIPPVVDGTPTDVQAVDADLGDEDGLTSTGVPMADASIESSTAAIHAMGGHAICYVDVGGAENYRSDFSEFDPSELGSPEQGWPDEQWINVTDWSTPVPSPYETIQQIMTNRLALCKEEGFDAIEPDNDDAYSNDPLGGFSLTMAQDETYLEELASIAHSDGLAIFLKNGINGDSFVSDMEPYVDGAINEQCWQYSECSSLEPFVTAGKPILNVEYQSFPESALCPEALAFPMASVQAGVDLTGPINYGCWQYGSAPAGTTTSVPPTTTPGSTTTATAATTTTTTTAAPATTSTTAGPVINGAAPAPFGTTPASYLPDSVFTQDVQDWDVDPSSAQFVSDLVADYEDDYGSVGVNTGQPIFEAPAGTPMSSISVAQNCHDFLSGTGSQVPVPSNVVIEDSSDSPMVIYSPSLNAVWEFWQFTETSSGYQACWGGKATLSTFDGIFPAPYGLSATGISYLATAITEQDIQSGSIDHAIAIILPSCNGSTYPSDRTDCGSEPGQPPEGQWFRFSSSVDCPDYAATPFEHMVCVAGQKYGFVVTDQGGAVMLEGEDRADWAAQGNSGSDPITASWDGQQEYEVVADLPWDQLEAVDPGSGAPVPLAAPAPGTLVAVPPTTVASSTTTNNAAVPAAVPGPAELPESPFPAALAGGAFVVLVFGFGLRKRHRRHEAKTAR